MKMTLSLVFIFISSFLLCAQDYHQEDHKKDLTANSLGRYHFVRKDSVFLYLDIDKLPKFNVKGYESAISYLYANVKYSVEADVVGTVIVSFVITSNGMVKDVIIEKSLYSECDDEVKRVLLSMPKWEAGIKNGVRVDTRLLLSVKFHIA